MIDVICSLIVTVCMADCSFGIETRTDAKGKIKASSPTTYVIDFSKAAKNGDWMGDYSTKIVKKSDCVKLNENK